MPRRNLFTDQERESLLLFPTERDELIHHYTLTTTEREWISSRRGDGNRLGFAVQLCAMKFPGIVLAAGSHPPAELLDFIGGQLKIPASVFSKYSVRQPTRIEHIADLQTLLGVRPYNDASDRSLALAAVEDVALRTDKGVNVAHVLIAHLRSRKLLLPNIHVLTETCAEAVTSAERQIYTRLASALTEKQRKRLDALLVVDSERGVSGFTWLQQTTSKPTAAGILKHIERLRAINELKIPSELRQSIHQNRLLKLARIGRQSTVQHMREWETNRKYATLVAVILETRATVIDEIVDLNDRIIGGVFNGAKSRHDKEFLEARKSIVDNLKTLAQVGRAVLGARKKGSNPISAIGRIVTWDELERILNDVDRLTGETERDFLPRTIEGFWKVHRYSDEFLRALEFHAAPAAKDVLDAMTGMRRIHDEKSLDAASLPLAFVKQKWRSLVIKSDGIDLRYYELCAMAELRNALRSGDVWVAGSRQFKDFEEYLIPQARFDVMKRTGATDLGVELDCEKYLSERLGKLGRELELVNTMAKQNLLTDVQIDHDGLSIGKIENSVPPEAKAFCDKVYGMVPRVKITDVLTDVEEWTGFTKHFTHTKSERPTENKRLLLTGILADGLNLGPVKMAEACPGTSYEALSSVYGWHIRDETYNAAIGELINAQKKLPAAQLWGDGTRSSSDGQRFPTGSHAYDGGRHNPKYGSGPGVTIYSYISDQYGRFYSKVITSGLRDATHVLDGLMYHESELRIKEHYTDTAGFTEHIFALMHLLGFKYAPRLRGLGEMKLYIPPGASGLDRLDTLIGDKLDLRLIRSHWDEILRLASSIRHGTVTASVMVRKLGNYPRQNRLALALRELGRLERTLFILEWLKNPALRQRVGAELNKSESAHALCRAVFLHRAGEVRDRTIQAQKYRASGLNLVVAAIILWNSTYVGRVIESMRSRGIALDAGLLSHLSPIGWEHINLTGDYVWRTIETKSEDGFRPFHRPSFG